MRNLFAISAFLVLANPIAAAELSVGFAEADITPELGKKPVYLAGFGQGRVAKSVHDPLMARAIVLADGDTKIALVSVDVVGLFYNSAERIRAKIKGFKYVLISATHNHEGPDTIGLWGPNPFKSGIDAEYLASVEQACADVVKAASTKLKPTVVKIGTASDPTLINDNRLPLLKHDEIVTIRFEDPQTKKPLCVLVQWNCHPEVLDSRNTELTADFPHYTVKHLRESLQCPVAYFTGTVGGLMTSLKLRVTDERGNELKDGTFAKAERYGTLVGKLAEKALGTAIPVNLTPFEVRTQVSLVPVENKLYHLGLKLGTLNREIFEWNGEPAPKEFVATKDVTRAVAVKTEVGYLKLGDLEIAVIPGEIYPELVLGKVQDPVDPGADYPDAPIEPAIYNQLKGKHRMLIGLGNDELGYFIPKRQWDEKPPYCYGLQKAQYGEQNSVGPDGASIICAVFKSLVNGK